MGLIFWGWGVPLGPRRQLWWWGWVVGEPQCAQIPIPANNASGSVGAHGNYFGTLGPSLNLYLNPNLSAHTDAGDCRAELNANLAELNAKLSLFETL